MSPCLLVSPFVSAAAHQSIKTNRQRQKENKGLGKEEGGWGIGKQPSSTAEVNLHGPAVKLVSATQVPIISEHPVKDKWARFGS